MIIHNNRSYEIFLGWCGQFGKRLPANTVNLGSGAGNLEIDDQFATNSYFRGLITRGDIAVVSYNSQPFDYVVQSELVSGGLSDVVAGSLALPSGTDTAMVTFLTPLLTVNYTVMASLENSIDPAPGYRIIQIKDKLVSGFTAMLSDETDTANYILNWQIKLL